MWHMLTAFWVCCFLLLLGKWEYDERAERHQDAGSQEPSALSIAVDSLPDQQTPDYSQDSATRYRDVDPESITAFDLIEQGRMADATETQIRIGWLAFVLNAVGLVILWKALRVSIESSNAAKMSADTALASIRPWITLDTTSFSSNGSANQNTTAIYFHLTWKNTGESPATGIAITACHYAAGNEILTVPRNSHFAPNNNIGFLAKGATSEGKLSFAIAEINDAIQQEKDIICFIKAEYSFPEKGSGGTLLCYRLSFEAHDIGYGWESGVVGECCHIF